MSDPLKSIVAQLAEQLKKEREQQGYSVTFVAQFLGVPESTLEEWESGESSPPGTVIYDLAHLYGADAINQLAQIITVLPFGRSHGG